MNRLADRIGSQPDVPMPPAHNSDVHALPGGPAAGDLDDALDFPPMAPYSPQQGDAFAEFEEMTGEATRIDDSHLLAEQSTAILEEAPRQPFLAVERGNDQGREFVLQDGENGVGRGIDNDVILADVAVSRRHMRIIRDGNTLNFRDLGSGNGTLVNGKRVGQTILVDGDRLELGETVLVVRIPGTELRADPADGQTTDENQLAAAPPTPTASPVTPGYHPELTPRATSTQHIDRSRKGTIVLPRPIFVAILLGGALLIALLAATMAILVVRSGSSDDERHVVDVGTAADPFPRGVAAYDARRWDDAEAAFRESLQETSDPRATAYLQRVQQARLDEGLINRARNALAAGNANEALTAVGGVGPQSPYAPDAAALRAQAVARGVGDHVQAGQIALAANNFAEANRRLQQARALDPTSPMVASLAAAIAARGGTAQPVAPVPAPAPVVPAPVAPVPPAPVVPQQAVAPPQQAIQQPEPQLEPEPPARGGRGGRNRARATPSNNGQDAVQEVISAYLAGRFDQAARSARAASGQASGAQRNTLSQLAERITRFGQLYQRIQAANFAPSVRPQMEQAIQLDRQIARNPQYSSRLRRAVVDAYLLDARRTRSQPQQSCNFARQALAVDSSNGEARQMASQCENIARGMMREAASAPPARAEGIYRQVLLMVPSGSSAASEASGRLQSLRRGAMRDEDE